MDIRNRISALEARALLHTNEALTEADCRRLERWPEIVLQRYCEGRLDELASAFEPLQKLLRGLLEDGFAIQSGGSWHPIYTIGDQWLDLRVVNRLKTMLNGEMS
jgi:hypothetical protein